MNKKAVETTVIMTAFKILAGAVIAIVLVSLIFKFISPNGAKDEGKNYLYFVNLAKDLTNMKVGDVKTSSYLTTKDSVLLAFNNDIDIIKQNDLDKSCFNYFLTKDVEEPVKCRDKNCLCSCKSILVITKLSVDCDDEESQCIELNAKVNPANTCKAFVLYDYDEKTYDLNLKKEKDSFTIISNLSKTL